MAVFLIWFFYPTWAMYSFVFGRFVESGQSIAGLGTFGDSFGALNTLFSGLAFVGLYISIRLQSKELSETRDVLQEQSDQLRTQSDQFKEQTSSLIRQTFESTFFQLIKNYREAVENVHIEVITENQYNVAMKKTDKISATDVYDLFINKKIDVIHTFLKYESRSNYEIFFEGMLTVGVFKNVFYEPMRVLERILFFVHQSTFTRKEKVFYLSLLSAKMSKSEMQFIFYYGLSDIGEIKNIIERAGLLANFDLDDPMPFDFFSLYKLYAYGDFSSVYWDDNIAEIIQEDSSVEIYLSSQKTGYSFKISKPTSIPQFKRLCADAPYYTMFTSAETRN